ncbi:hypothetical protein GCK32_010212 [Trichostrongylus colubriformis]|uniref:Uncharacterized protein n=1 Tax=Trichostrongylus colubriformis TaxID=6319 RepID=A0AAN8F036_TRICO
MLTDSRNIALTFFLQIPRTRDYTFVLYCSGPAHSWWPYGMVIMIVLSCATMGCLVNVGNNFLYRYITLCRSNLSYVYSSKPHLIIGALINLLLVLNWVAMIYFVLWPSDEFVETAEKVWQGRIKVAGTVYIGVSNLGGAHPFKMAMLIESLVMLLSVAQVNPFCAMQIHRCLKDNSSSLSTRTKKMQMKMFVLLSIQITCPTLLMHIPLGTVYLLLFCGFTCPPYIGNFVGFGMALYPLLGPIITITFVKDYRKAFLAMLRLAKNLELSQGPLPTAVMTASSNSHFKAVAKASTVFTPVSHK